MRQPTRLTSASATGLASEQIVFRAFGRSRRPGCVAVYGRCRLVVDAPPVRTTRSSSSTKASGVRTAPGGSATCVIGVLLGRETAAVQRVGGGAARTKAATSARDSWIGVMPINATPRGRELTSRPAPQTWAIILASGTGGFP